MVRYQPSDVFGFDVRQPTLIVMSAREVRIDQTDDEEERRSYLTSMDQVQSAELVRDVLRAAGCESVRLAMAPNVSKDHLNTNVVLLGGPRKNMWSEAVEGAANNFSFGADHSFRVGKQDLFKTIYKDKKPYRDFALVASVPSPWFRPRRVFAIMGCRGYGTVGAAQFLGEQTFWAEIADKRSGALNWVAAASFQVTLTPIGTTMCSNARLEHVEYW